MRSAILLFALGLTVAPLSAAQAAQQPQWPGHRPGHTYVGVHGPSHRTGPAAVNRTYYQWNDNADEDRQIRRDHRNGKLPWVSFKPPKGGWQAVSSGRYDRAIRAKARRYAGYRQPVLTTFHHEPVGDGRARQWVRAYLHIRRVMLDEVGDLGKTTYAPIINGYLWNDWYSGEKGARTSWLPRRVMRVSPLVGIDHYGTPRETRRALSWLREHGARSVGIAEFGRENGPREFRAQLRMLRNRDGLVSVVTYFNSRDHYFANSSSPYGPGRKERRAFRAYQDDTVYLRSHSRS